MQEARTKEENQELVELYRQSGMTVRAFAEEFNLNLGTFRNWHYKKQPEKWNRNKYSCKCGATDSWKNPRSSKGYMKINFEEARIYVRQLHHSSSVANGLI